jgi:hypothetical protein
MTLTSLCHSCMMTETIYVYPLNGEIHCQMMLLHGRHAPTLLSETSVYVKIQWGSTDLLHVAQDRDK